MHDFDPLQLPAGDFAGAKTRNAPGKFSPVQITDADHFPGLEISFAPGDARRQQTLAILAQRFFRPLVHE